MASVPPAAPVAAHARDDRDRRAAVVRALSTKTRTTKIGSVTFDQNVPWSSFDGETRRTDVFHPPGSARHPAVIMIHGGAWSSGDKLELSFLGAALATYGFVAVAPNYRIASPSPYPDEVHDVQASVRWVRAHARALSVDPRRIALFGSSAGGNLVALAATLGTGRDDRGDRVAAVVSWSGIYDFTTLVAPGTRPIRPAACGSACPLSVFARNYIGRDRSADPQRYRVASPVAHVDRSDPPELLVGSTAELAPVGQQAAMAIALRRRGVPVEVVVFPGKRHSMQYLADALAPTVSFLQRRL